MVINCQIEWLLVATLVLKLTFLNMISTMLLFLCLLLFFSSSLWILFFYLLLKPPWYLWALTSVPPIPTLHSLSIWLPVHGFLPSDAPTGTFNTADSKLSSLSPTPTSQEPVHTIQESTHPYLPICLNLAIWESFQVAHSPSSSTSD